MHAWGLASNMVRMLEPIAQFHVLHVGETLPTFGNLLPHVDLRRGPRETILEVAEKARRSYRHGDGGPQRAIRRSARQHDGARVARRALPSPGDTLEAAP